MVECSEVLRDKYSAPSDTEMGESSAEEDGVSDTYYKYKLNADHQKMYGQWCVSEQG